MSQAKKSRVTSLLRELKAGNRSVLGELFTLVYDELRNHAHWHRVHWHGDLTVNTTALVHEAYLKLVDHEQVNWENRAHFLATAAQAMRHILIDYARHRRAQKRGGHIQKVSLEQMNVLRGEVPITDEYADLLVALGDALKRLEIESEREARVVDCRFFGAMTVEETATALDISERTVKRDWAMARAWLKKEIHQHPDYDRR